MKMEPIILDKLILEPESDSRLWFEGRHPGAEQTARFIQTATNGEEIKIKLNIKTLDPGKTEMLLDPNLRFKLTIERI